MQDPHNTDPTKKACLAEYADHTAPIGQHELAINTSYRSRALKGVGCEVGFSDLSMCGALINVSNHKIFRGRTSELLEVAC